VPDATAYTYDALVTRVIDGDTTVLSVDLGFFVHVTIHGRLKGINAPEHNKPGGPEATAFLTSLVLEQQVQVTSHKVDKYGGRWDVELRLNGADVAQQMIAAGHAVPYDGGKR
jgi:micrococcal nuclease